MRRIAHHRVVQELADIIVSMIVVGGVLLIIAWTIRPH